MTAATRGALKRLRAERKATARSLADREDSPHGLDRYLAGRQRQKLARLDATIADLEAALPPEPAAAEGDTMLTNDHQMTPPGAGYVLRAGVTFNAPELAGALGLPGPTIPRGTVIPIELLALHVANSETMLRAAVLKWTLPTAPPRTVPPLPTPAPTAVRARDHFRELAAAVKPWLERGKSLDQALDLVDADQVVRALTAYTHRPGQRHGQRSPQGFRQKLVELIEGAAP